MIIALLLFFKVAWAMPPVNYSAEQRIEYLKSVFVAFQHSSSQTVKNTYEYLRNQNQYACAAQAEQLRIQCLIQQAGVSCSNLKGEAKVNCDLISDVIATNLIDEKTFLDPNELQKILHSSKGSSAQIYTAINGRYARLTAEFLLATEGRCASQDSQCLSKEINNFCISRANVRKESWQGCSGALLWFIGSNLNSKGVVGRVTKNL